MANKLVPRAGIELAGYLRTPGHPPATTGSSVSPTAGRLDLLRVTGAIGGFSLPV